MKSSMVFILLVSIGSLVFCNACSSNRVIREQVESAEVLYHAQKPIEVRTSKNDDRPMWTKRSMVQDDECGGIISFSGAFLGGSDYPTSIRCANAEALKVVVQSVSQFVRAEFSGFVEGPNSGISGVNRYVEDGIASFVDCLHLQGARQAEIYYEELFSPIYIVPSYNVWVRVEMDKLDYLRVKAEALRRLKSRFKDKGQEQVKQKAEDLLRKLEAEVKRYGT